MSDLTARLNAIQERAETSASGNFAHLMRQEYEVIHSDVPFLLDLARKQQATLDAARELAEKTHHYAQLAGRNDGCVSTNKLLETLGDEA